MKTKRRRRLWWMQGSLIALVSIGLILAAYRFGWTETGFPGKTVWDWLQLLIIPLALALVALVVNQANTRTERQIAQQRYEQDQQLALDKQREDLLQAYLDRMTELLLEKGLRTSLPEAEVRNVARVRTISILMQLDSRRVETVFAFLREAGLIAVPQPVVTFSQARLTQVNWNGTRLSKVNFSETYLRGANLSNADLTEANLSNADLTDTNLRGAVLSGANLRGAVLSFSNLIEANLSGANLSNANLIGINLSNADLRNADLCGADLSFSNLSEADLRKARLGDAKLREANLSKAVFRGADLNGADLKKTNLEDADSLTDMNLRGVTGLTREQLAICKAHCAIVDEDATISAYQSIIAPASLPQSNDVQVPSTSPIQGNAPTPDVDGDHASSSKPCPES